MLYQSVLDAFPSVTAKLEGVVLWPYLDVLGLATVGYGCLCDSPAGFTAIKWTPVIADAIELQQRAALKARPKALHYKLYESATTLRMTTAAVDELLDLRALDFAGYMQEHYFPAWDTWPADAQLAAMLMAWACGPAFPHTFTNFTGYCLKRDWVNAAKCAAIRTQGNPGIVPRNAQVQLCLANAAAIDSPDGYATPALYWPGVVQDAPEAVHLSAPAAADALASFNADDCGLTGHCHAQAA